MNPQGVLEAVQTINRTWLEGRPQDMRPLIHPEITMVIPGFAGSVTGRDAFIAGFEEFCNSAKLQSFKDDDYQVDVIGGTAVTSFRYEMVYEREGSTYRATGRDLWVFARQDANWLAVWRTMLELQEEPV
jgi:hypothetical protein